IHEKAIVLSAATKLRDVLNKSGRYAAVMTRDTDIFLSLKARVAHCRNKGAALMISLHADSAGNALGARGATVYTLSEKASDAEAEELAKSENRADQIAGIHFPENDDLVSSILIDLAQKETKGKSIDFARSLVVELQETGPMVPKSHKFAGFRVLKAPDVPSVLIEMGYLTNAQDEGRILDERWQWQFAKAVTRAVDTYFSRSGPNLGAPQP
ncbi:MAG TPA: N-acetylmuramoyl-L-alanine amidase, partial [Alphaproteobacteria bacterium]|nr:N-acetylmuramoyl-L-alanine amidase [Alphaproteobacteria bacterium]